MVGRGVRQGCPLSCILYSLCIEPLQIRLRASLPGFPVMPTERPIVISAYADDVCVVVGNSDDVTMLLNDLEKLSSTCHPSNKKNLHHHFVLVFHRIQI